MSDKQSTNSSSEIILNSMKTELLESGVQIVTLDMPDESMNVLRESLIEEFMQIFTEAEKNTAVSAIVFKSGKDDFIAGADVSMIDSAETFEHVEALSQKLQDLTLFIENFSKPTAAVIHGVCLGGGLELAMAFDYRVASTDKSTKLGVPEVQLGLLPGGGGTQRLPRLVDLPTALDMALTGRNLSAKKSYRVGLVSEIASEGIILDVAEKLVLLGKPKRRKVAMKDKVLKLGLARKFVFNKAREKTLAKTFGNYPAPLKIIDAMEYGLEKGFTNGLEKERQGFAELAMSSESKQLRHIYFSTTELKKDTGVEGNPADLARPVEKVGILGAGLMGAGIAYVSMKNAGAKVRLKDRDIEGVGKGINYINKLLRKQLQRRRISDLEKRQLQSKLSSTADYSGFKSADIVIEAVFEDLNLKRQMIADIEGVEDSKEIIFATNTSALPIDDIAKGSQQPERVIGMHYFSPVEKMPLLEIVVGTDTSDWVVATCVEFGKKQGKTVIVVNDGPGFYTTRILAPYINEATRMVYEGVEIEKIDSALQKAGFPVGPIILLDEVGIDVASHIADTMHESFGERLSPLAEMQNVIDDDRKGRKNNRGFYHYNLAKKGLFSGMKTSSEKQVDSSIYDVLGASPPGSHEITDIEIADRCLLQMVNEAAYCLEEGILRTARDGDIGAIFGLGFPPFLGGPFRYADSIGINVLVNKLEKLESDHGLRFKPAPSLIKMAKEGKSFYSK